MPTQNEIENQNEKKKKKHYFISIPLDFFDVGDIKDVVTKAYIENTSR